MYTTKFSPQFSKWNVKIILFLGIFAILALIRRYYTINRRVCCTFNPYPTHGTENDVECIWHICLTIQKPSSISFHKPYDIAKYIYRNMVVYNPVYPVSVLYNAMHAHISRMIHYFTSITISYLDSHKNFGVSICICEHVLEWMDQSNAKPNCENCLCNVKCTYVRTYNSYMYTNEWLK